MTIPGWLLGIFAAIMLVVAAVAAARLGAARPWRRGAARAGSDVDVAHLLMGIAMAGMLAARLSSLPAGAWEVVFAVATGWFAWRVAGDARGRGAAALAGGHYAPHLVHSAAMLYMFAALTRPVTAGGGSVMAGMGGAAGGVSTLQVPTLALAFALLLAGYAVWDLDQLASGGRASPDPESLRPRPRYAGDTGAPAGPGPANPAPALAAAAADLGLSAAGGVPGGAPAAVQPDIGARAPQIGRAEFASRMLAPQAATGSRIAMSVTMALMLVIMI
jgi:hypothetical protein